MYKTVHIEVRPASERFRARESRNPPLYSSIGDDFAGAVRNLQHNFSHACAQRGKPVPDFSQTTIIDYFADAGLDVEITTETYKF